MLTTKTKNQVEGNVGYYKYLKGVRPYARSDTVEADTRARRTHLSEKQNRLSDIAIKRFIGLSRARSAKRGTPRLTNQVK